MSAPTVTDSPTDRALQWLVRGGRFIAVPSTNEKQLEFCRWWTGDYADKLIIRGEHDAELQRFADVDRNQPVQGRLVRRDRRTVVAIPEIVRTWGRPAPDSCPLRLSLSRVDGLVEAPFPRHFRGHGPVEWGRGAHE